MNNNPGSHPLNESSPVRVSCLDTHCSTSKAVHRKDSYNLELAPSVPAFDIKPTNVGCSPLVCERPGEYGIHVVATQGTVTAQRSPSIAVPTSLHSSREQQCSGSPGLLVETAQASTRLATAPVKPGLLVDTAQAPTRLTTAPVKPGLLVDTAQAPTRLNTAPVKPGFLVDTAQASTRLTTVPVKPERLVDTAQASTRLTTVPVKPGPLVNTAQASTNLITAPVKTVIKNCTVPLKRVNDLPDSTPTLDFPSYPCASYYPEFNSRDTNDHGYCSEIITHTNSTTHGSQTPRHAFNRDFDHTPYCHSVPCKEKQAGDAYTEERRQLLKSIKDEKQPCDSGVSGWVRYYEGVKTGLLDHLPRSTRIKTKSDVAVLLSFLRSEPQSETRNIEDIPPEELDSYLMEFFGNIKKVTGEDYGGGTMSTFMGSFNRYLKLLHYPFSLYTSCLFFNSRRAMENRRDKLTKAGCGKKKLRIPVLTPEEIKSLKEQNLLGFHNPVSLLNSLYHSNCVNFNLKKKAHHYRLLWSDLKLKVNSKGKEYLLLDRYRGRQLSKKHRVFAQPQDPTTCPIALYKAYRDKRPKEFQTDRFYLTPVVHHYHVGKIWYKPTHMGKNSLANMMNSMLQRGCLQRTSNNNLRSGDTVDHDGSSDESDTSGDDMDEDIEQEEKTRIQNMKETGDRHLIKPLPKLEHHLKSQVQNSNETGDGNCVKRTACVGTDVDVDVDLASNEERQNKHQHADIKCDTEGSSDDEVLFIGMDGKTHGQSQLQTAGSKTEPLSSMKGKENSNISDNPCRGNKYHVALPSASNKPNESRGGDKPCHLPTKCLYDEPKLATDSSIQNNSECPSTKTSVKPQRVTKSVKRWSTICMQSSPSMDETHTSPRTKVLKFTPGCVHIPQRAASPHVKEQCDVSNSPSNMWREKRDVTFPSTDKMQASSEHVRNDTVTTPHYVPDQVTPTNEDRVLCPYTGLFLTKDCSTPMCDKRSSYMEEKGQRPLVDPPEPVLPIIVSVQSLAVAEDSNGKEKWLFETSDASEFDDIQPESITVTEPQDPQIETRDAKQEAEIKKSFPLANEANVSTNQEWNVLVNSFPLTCGDKTDVERPSEMRTESVLESFSCLVYCLPDQNATLPNINRPTDEDWLTIERHTSSGHGFPTQPTNRRVPSKISLLAGLTWEKYRRLFVELFPVLENTMLSVYCRAEGDREPLTLVNLPDLLQIPRLLYIIPYTSSDRKPLPVLVSEHPTQVRPGSKPYTDTSQPYTDTGQYPSCTRTSLSAHAQLHVDTNTHRSPYLVAPVAPTVDTNTARSPHLVAPVASTVDTNTDRSPYLVAPVVPTVRAAQGGPPTHDKPSSYTDILQTADIKPGSHIPLVIATPNDQGVPQSRTNQQKPASTSYTWSPLTEREHPTSGKPLVYSDILKTADIQSGSLIPLITTFPNVKGLSESRTNPQIPVMASTSYPWSSLTSLPSTVQGSHVTPSEGKVFRNSVHKSDCQLTHLSKSVMSRGEPALQTVTVRSRSDYFSFPRDPQITNISHRAPTSATLNSIPHGHQERSLDVSYLKRPTEARTAANTFDPFRRLIVVPRLLVDAQFAMSSRVGGWESRVLVVRSDQFMQDVYSFYKRCQGVIYFSLDVKVMVNNSLQFVEMETIMMFTKFWRLAFETWFEGNKEFVPKLSALFDSDCFKVLGTILAHGLIICSYWPLKLSRACAVAVLTGSQCSDRTLTLSYPKCILDSEVELVEKLSRYPRQRIPREYTSRCDRLLRSYGCGKLRETGYVGSLLSSICRVHLLHRPYWALVQMNEGVNMARIEHRFRVQESDVIQLYEYLLPSATTILARIKLQVSKKGEGDPRPSMMSCIGEVLERMDTEQLQKLLKLWTGSDCQSYREIYVEISSSEREITLSFVAKLRRMVLHHSYMTPKALRKVLLEALNITNSFH